MLRFCSSNAKVIITAQKACVKAGVEHDNYFKTSGVHLHYDASGC